MNRGMANFAMNKGRIKKLNETNRGVSFAINPSANLDDEQWAKIAGGGEVPFEHIHEAKRNVPHEDPHGRSLYNVRSVDWIEAGKVHPPKWQGECGSCWAFASTLVQESMEAIQKDLTPVQLSEQEGLDCSQGTSGCGGGWPTYYLTFARDAGSQTAQDYPYEFVQGDCRHQENKKVASRVAQWGRADDSTTQMKMQLQEGPLIAAVSSVNDCWRFYSAGILSSANNCPTNIDHIVAIVGVHIAEQPQTESGDCPGIKNEAPAAESEQDYWIIQNSWS